MAIVLIQIVSWVLNILTFLLLARAAMSWVMMYMGGSRNYNSTLSRLYRILVGLTEPFVKPVRNFLSRFMRPGPIDFAPLAVFFIIIIISRILSRILIELIRLG